MSNEKTKQIALLENLDSSYDVGVLWMIFFLFDSLRPINNISVM